MLDSTQKYTFHRQKEFYFGVKCHNTLTACLGMATMHLPPGKINSTLWIDAFYYPLEA